jgi:hypothetical protein
MNYLELAAPVVRRPWINYAVGLRALSRGYRMLSAYEQIAWELGWGAAPLGEAALESRPEATGGASSGNAGERDFIASGIRRPERA